METEAEATLLRRRRRGGEGFGRTMTLMKGCADMRLLSTHKEGSGLAEKQVARRGLETVFGLSQSRNLGTACQHWSADLGNFSIIGAKVRVSGFH